MSAWVAVLPAGEVERNGVTLVRAAGRDYVVYDAPDRLYASLAYCTHAGALLRDGYFDRHLIECPLHQGCFDVRTGEPKGRRRPARSASSRCARATAWWSSGSGRAALRPNRPSPGSGARRSRAPVPCPGRRRAEAHGPRPGR